MLFLSIGKNVSDVTSNAVQLKLAPASIRTMFNLHGFLQNLAEPTNHGGMYETGPKNKKLSRPHT